MARISWGKIAAGVAGAAGIAAAGAAWFYLREKKIETPDHETIEGDGAFEIRRYPAIRVAETHQPGARDRALGNGFGLLADYFFAESREGDEIDMTAPVFAAEDPAGNNSGWIIRFVLPKQLDERHIPAPGAGIRLAEIPARTVAVVRFGGRADDRMLAMKEAELAGWLAERGLEAGGPFEHAFYNSPIMPGPLRHNEVLVPLAE